MNQINSFLPSIRIFQLLGINTFAVDKNNKAVENRGLKAYSLLHIGLSLLTLSGLYYEKHFYTKGTRSGIANSVDFLQLLLIKLAKLVILIESIREHKMLKNFFEVIAEVDQTSEKLGISPNFRMLRRKNLMTTISSVIFYAGLQVVLLIMILIGEPIQMISFWSSYIFPYLVCCIRYYQIISCVYLIKTRIEGLNLKLGEMKMGKISFEQNYIKTVHLELFTMELKSHAKFNFIRNFEKLFLFRKMYNKLYILSTIINYSFGLSNLVNIANGFVSITANTYFIFLCFQNKPFQHDDYMKILGSFIWSLPHVVNIVALSAVCHFTVYTVSSCFKYLLKFK